jgi:hypothetical protein
VNYVVLALAFLFEGASWLVAFSQTPGSFHESPRGQIAKAGQDVRP